MQALLKAACIVSLLLVCDNVAARQWISRDGRYHIEAELLAVEQDQVVLRRKDGPVIRVPLDRLSFSDVKYVNDAIEASAAVSRIVNESSQVATPGPEEPPSMLEPGAPPLADASISAWQVVPDPSELGYDLGPETEVNLSFTTRNSRPYVLFPSVPSPFVVLGDDDYFGSRQVWDLRTGEAVAKFDGELTKHDVACLSPDGKYLAFVQSGFDPKVALWSFADGKLLHELEPSEQPSIRGVQFANSNRLIVGDSSASAYFVFDVASGELRIKIDSSIYSPFESAVSPGGHYLAALSSKPPGIALYDIRNGARAGLLEIDGKNSGRPECLVFSSDGRELAGSWKGASDYAIRVWDMNDGNRLVTHRYKAHPYRDMSLCTYDGRPFEWLVDRSGWLFGGLIVIDHETGKTLWRDEAAAAAVDLLPRRIVDGNRLLVFDGQDKEMTLKSVLLPLKAFADAREVVAAGGQAMDIGLPPITEASMDGIREMTSEDVAWAYEAAPRSLPDAARSRSRLSLGMGFFDLLQTFFSRPDAARIVTHNTEPAGNSLANGSPGPSGVYQLHDLCTGKKIAQFAAPFKTVLLDLSPDGKLGLFRIARDEDRLDIWDLERGIHVQAFRPFGEQEGSGRRVQSAWFLDEEHVMTESSTSRMIVWELPECRALYGYPTNKGSVAGMTRDRRVLFLLSQGKTRLIDTSTGESVGTLAAIEDSESWVRQHSELSHDELRMAALFVNRESSMVVVWDLSDGSKIQQVALPTQPLGLVWCGDDHLLLNGKHGKEGFESLLDVERGLIVWNYRMSARRGLWNSPDARHWYLHRASYNEPTELAAVALPDAEVKTLLTQNVLPKPLFGPGATVCLETRIENVPQNLPPGWEDLESVEEGLRSHFSRQLEEKQIQVADSAPARLVIEIKYQKKEAGNAAPRSFDQIRAALAAAAELTPYVALFDADGNCLWERKYEHVEGSEIALFEGLAPGSNLAQHLKLKRWEAAVRWLRSSRVPYLIYPPGAQLGYGDSIITPNGSRILRKPGKGKQ